jgi:hypothetical protein
VIKGRRSGTPCRRDLGIGCAVRTSKSLSLSKSSPERSFRSHSVIWSTEKRRALHRPSTLFATFFYLGFIRKWERHFGHDLRSKQREDSRGRHHFDARHGGGRLGNGSKSHRGGTRFSSCRISHRCEDEKLLQPPSVRPLDKSVSKASPIFRRFMSLETTPFVGIGFL